MLLTCPAAVSVQQYPLPTVTSLPGYRAARVTVCDSATVARPLTSALPSQVRETVFAPSDAVSFGHMFNGVALRASEVRPTRPAHCSGLWRAHGKAAAVPSCRHGWVKSEGRLALCGSEGADKQDKTDTPCDLCSGRAPCFPPKTCSARMRRTGLRCRLGTLEGWHASAG